jgi:1,2-diacylglycerol 3-alpha-glucosyltransferase
MVGSGYSESSIRSYASRLGLEGEFVRFLGKVSDTDTMKGLYLSSDLFFFPSIYDNAPLVVREAAAMGTPSLLVRGSNAAEKVDDGVNGFLTEESSAAAADRIQAVFAASGLAVQAGEQARLTLCRPWEDILTSVAEKYAEVLS